MDVFSPSKRSEIMARIRGSDTRPEKIVKARLWAAGYRYSRKQTTLVGRPDIVFPKYKVAAFVHGCFWHGHSCSRGRLPATNVSFWEIKIATNRKRDRRVLRLLRADGWQCFQIWQCRLDAGINRLTRRLELLRRQSKTKN